MKDDTPYLIVLKTANIICTMYKSLPKYIKDAQKHMNKDYAWLIDESHKEGQYRAYQLLLNLLALAPKEDFDRYAEWLEIQEKK